MSLDTVTSTPFSPTAEPATLKVGLIGGMSWYSTIEYYRSVNTLVQERLGGHRSARIVVESLDFEEIRAAQVAEDWSAAAEALSAAGERLEASGVDALAICTNLMHKVAPEVASRTSVPLLHIADAVAGRLAVHEISSVALLGTRWVMEEDFYAQHLAAREVEVLVPEPEDRGRIDAIVFDELTRGVVTEASRAEFARIMTDLAGRGALAAVLACTEIEYLFRNGDDPAPLPLVDSMEVHAERIADFCLSARR